MKVKILIIAVIAMMGLMTSKAKAQVVPCAVTITSVIDCNKKVDIYINCSPGGRTLVVSDTLAFGTWATPNPTTFPLPASYCPLPRGCRIEIEIDGVLLTPGISIVCCNYPPTASPNNCGRFQDTGMQTYKLEQP